MNNVLIFVIASLSDDETSQRANVVAHRRHLHLLVGRCRSLRRPRGPAQRGRAAGPQQHEEELQAEVQHVRGRVQNH